MPQSEVLTQIKKYVKAEIVRERQRQRNMRRQLNRLEKDTTEYAYMAGASRGFDTAHMDLVHVLGLLMRSSCKCKLAVECTSYSVDERKHRHCRNETGPGSWCCPLQKINKS